MRLDNPFLIRGYAGPEYFCDRTAETQQLVSAISNGRDVTLVAPRRYGKTGLIHNAVRMHGDLLQPCGAKDAGTETDLSRTCPQRLLLLPHGLRDEIGQTRMPSSLRR